MKPSAKRNKPRYCLKCNKPYSAEYWFEDSPSNRAFVCAECANDRSLWSEGVKFVLIENEAARIKAFQADGSPGPGVKWLPKRDWRKEEQVSK